MVLRWVSVVSLFYVASSLNTGGCAKALARCGGVNVGDAVFFVAKSPTTWLVTDIDNGKRVDCPSWIFEEVDQALCPVIEYPYLVSLFAYAVMIASIVLMLAGWMATLCTEDNVCVFRAALATYWFGDFGAAIFAGFMVQTYHASIGEYHWLLSLACTNAYTCLAYDVPMMGVQYVFCIRRRRGAVFATCAGALGILWSGVAYAMALNPQMGMLYGAHPLKMALCSFLLDMVKKLAVRQLWKCMGYEPNKQLDLELGLCCRSIASPVPQDNLAAPTATPKRNVWRMLASTPPRQSSPQSSQRSEVSASTQADLEEAKLQEPKRQPGSPKAVDCGD